MRNAYASIKRGLEQAIRNQKGKRVPGLKLHGAREPRPFLRAAKRARA